MLRCGVFSNAIPVHLDRYDVLAAVMTEVNTTLTERFNSLFQLQADGTRHEFVEAATLGDLHQVIDWMATCKSPQASGLWDLMPKICQLYVHGGSTGAKVHVMFVCFLYPYRRGPIGTA
jgi:hypothetical protein